MANRFPLIIDTDDGNKFKELPVGDNLNLQGSSIVNASSIEVLGNLDVQSLTVNEQNLSTVAVTGSYNDLDDLPVSFSGSYTDLSNRPSIPTTTKNLTDVSLTDPTDGQILVFNSTSGTFEPQDQTDIDLSTSSINDLSDVITTGTTELKYLKYQSGAWRPGNINYSEILNKPTNVSSFVNDSGYLDPTYFAAENEIINDAVNTFNGDNIHNGFTTFDGRTDFFATVSIDNREALSDVIVDTNNISITAANNFTVASESGDINISGRGLDIVDDGTGAFIGDNDSELGISFRGELRFDLATISGITDLSTTTFEATTSKTSIVATNLDEDVIIDNVAKKGTFVDVETEGLNISQGVDPATSIGAPGDKAGDIIIGSDNASTRYLYYAGSDYDGASAIWYRVAMSNNW